MINLHTGLPGHGKTLFTLYFVQQLSEREKRPVYYSGIADLKLPWIELTDATKWFDCPPGSIVVIDECQRLFRPRSFGSQVPEYVSALETHRHGGIDLFLVTQHPMLVDTNVRRLVDRHRHIVRSFGMQRCTVHEFQELRDNPTKSREGSVRHEVSYPKEVFGWYKSAEVHTVKRRIPARVWFLLAAPVVLAVMVWAIAVQLGAYGKPLAERGGEGHPVAVRPSRDLAVSGGRVVPLTREQWFAQRVPRVADFAFTAPVYDEATRPVDPPVPMVCIDAKDRCTCYSQQAAKLRVSRDVCRQIVANGLHLDFRAPSAAPASSPRPEPVAASAPAPAPLDLREPMHFAPVPSGISR